MIHSLYVHIPFCGHICNYCDFSKLLYNKKWEEEYLKELKNEIDGYKIPLKSLKTIYIGGGTPTCLSNKSLENLLDYLKPYLGDNYEFTIEGNPDGLTYEKLHTLKAKGINRLSIGVQSSNDKTLSFLGRKHTFEDAKRCVSIAKDIGFNNISCDLIYATPNESIEELKKDIDALLSLDVPHLSTYSLTISQGTSFYNKGYKEANDAISAEMYNLILSSFRNAGYERYEVSNFAKKGFYSRHNLTYWKDEEYYGAGLGASGYVNNRRYTNTRSLMKYLKVNHIKEEETLTLNSQLEDYFLTNLRLAEGFKKESFFKRFNFKFEDKYKLSFDKLKTNGLLAESADSIYPTDQGILLLDRILLELF